MNVLTFSADRLSALMDKVPEYIVYDKPQIGHLISFLQETSFQPRASRQNQLCKFLLSRTKDTLTDMALFVDKDSEDDVLIKATLFKMPHVLDTVTHNIPDLQVEHTFENQSSSFSRYLLHLPVAPFFCFK